VQLLSDDTAALRFDETCIEIAPTERNHWLRPDVARAMGPRFDRRAQGPKEAARPATGLCDWRGVALAFDDDVTSRAPTLRRIPTARSVHRAQFLHVPLRLDVLTSCGKSWTALARIVASPVFELRRPREPRIPRCLATRRRRAATRSLSGGRGR